MRDFSSFITYPTTEGMGSTCKKQHCFPLGLMETSLTGHDIVLPSPRTAYSKWEETLATQMCVCICSFILLMNVAMRNVCDWHLGHVLGRRVWLNKCNNYSFHRVFLSLVNLLTIYCWEINWLLLGIWISELLPEAFRDIHDSFMILNLNSMDLIFLHT